MKKENMNVLDICFIDEFDEKERHISREYFMNLEEVEQRLAERRTYPTRKETGRINIVPNEIWHLNSFWDYKREDKFENEIRRLRKIIEDIKYLVDDV